MNKYYALLTNLGAAKLANAAALGTKLQITQMAVGDGGGTLPTPNASQTALTGEKRRASLNSLSIDAVNSSQIIAEQVIPEGEGGFWIREIGLFDADGVMIAVANCPETYKPQLQEGSGRTQTVRMILIVNSTDAVTLKIDPSVVLATRKYVDDRAIEVKQYVADQMAAHLTAIDPHQQYLKVTDIPRYIPTGIPLPYPTATPPVGWLKCNGAAFDKIKYPGLAAVYPAGTLPDLRGEFIRGWDDGRGADAGRAILSLQGGSIVGFDPVRSDDGLVGLPGVDSSNFTLLQGDKLPSSLDAVSHQWVAMAAGAVNRRPIASDSAVISRPRNVALNYIVRAA